MSVLEGVTAAVGTVQDPGSQAWSRPLRLTDLGLVSAVTVDPAGHAVVTVRLDPGFLMGLPTIMRALERRVAEVPGVASVHVEIDIRTTWDPGLMSDAGRRELARYRAIDRIVAGLGHRSDPATRGEVPDVRHRRLG